MAGISKLRREDPGEPEQDRARRAQIAKIDRELAAITPDTRLTTSEAERLIKRRTSLEIKARVVLREAVTLQYRHYINGIVYGPGRVIGPVDLIRQLAENEGRAEREEDDWLDRNGRAFIFGFTGRDLRETRVR